MATATDLKCRWLQPHTYNWESCSHTHIMHMATATHQKCRWLQPHTKNADGYIHTPRIQMATVTHLERGWLQASSDNLLVEPCTVLLTYKHKSILCISTYRYIIGLYYIPEVPVQERPCCFSTEPEARNKTMGDQQHSHRITPTHNYPSIFLENP
jgi:hypothetical protein